MENIENNIAEAVWAVYGIKVGPVVTSTDPHFGDLATNVAFQLAGELKKAPKVIADELAAKITGSSIESVSVAGAGFINIRLKDAVLWDMLDRARSKKFSGQTIVVEYSDPNPFKILHAGHIYTTVVGDAIARLLEAAGARVHRVNYGGDVGLHVARTMWAIVERLGGEKPEKLASVEKGQRSQWLADCYVKGNSAYEVNEAAKSEIIALNKRIYQIYSDNDQSSSLAQIYWTCRKWSYEAFDEFYDRFGTRMEKYYPESEVTELGLQTVRDQVGPVFEESQGAIVFRGDRYGLHTRVFVNSQGLPTYEAKEVGLILKKEQDYHADKSIIITGNEQQEYMSVVMKAIEQFKPDLVRATLYIPHGMLRLAEGGKMSSRKGNIVTADEVLDMTAKASKEVSSKEDDQVVLAAVKYAFLKQRIGGDIIYDPKESVSILGNSGPYLQYAHARARSILAKSSRLVKSKVVLENDERLLLRKLAEYPMIVATAIDDLMPHSICTYLYELSQTFNRFYETNRVIGDGREEVRLRLVNEYATVLKDGLELLNITAPEKI